MTPTSRCAAIGQRHGRAAGLRCRCPRPPRSARRSTPHARALKAAGDERPIGQLRGGGAARPGDPRRAGPADGRAPTSTWSPRWTPWSPRPREHPVWAGSRCWSTGSRSPPRWPGSCWNAWTRCARAGCRPRPTAPCRSSVTDADGRLIASLTRRELESAVRHGTGLVPAAGGRPVRAHPGAAAVRPDPRPHLPASRLRQPGRLGRPGPRRSRTPTAATTDCTNLCCLCRRHHRLKTHAPGWRYVMTPDGVLTVTTPTGITRDQPATRHDRPTTAPVLRVPAERDPDPPPF